MHAASRHEADIPPDRKNCSSNAVSCMSASLITQQQCHAGILIMLSETESICLCVVSNPQKYVRLLNDTTVRTVQSLPQGMLCVMQRGQCVLHVASSYGYPQMVKSLLQLKANVDCRDEVCSFVCTHCTLQLFSNCQSSLNS